MRRAALAALAILGGSEAAGYSFTGTRWPTSSITMHLQLGPTSTPLSDGSPSWNAAAENALAIWNSHLGSTRFTVVRDSTAARSGGNRTNNVFFEETVYGEAFGSGVLAITLTYSNSARQSTESDVVFNRALRWDSYRGPTRYSGGTVFDFHRVALHEFGHVLGLDHPDQEGQSVTALMNSRVSNLDTLAADDIAGAQALYGASTPLLQAPQISGQPASVTAVAGTNVTFSVAASGSAPLSYRWHKGGLPIAGATNSSLQLSAVTSASAGDYTVTVSNAAGTVTSNSARLTVTVPAPITSAPAIMTHPASQTINAGASVTFSASASGTPAPTFQWTKDGAPLAGATQSQLVIAAVLPADAGNYAVVATNSSGTATSNVAQLGVLYSELVNLSTRGFIRAGAALTAGFVVKGSAAKRILVRGIGPALPAFGVAGALSDPQLAVVAQTSSQTLATNDTWGSHLSPVFQRVGAFPLTTGSADAATEVQLPAGGYTSRITGSSSGVALAEIYDAQPGSVAARLSNLSTLGFTGSGENALVAGFTVQGNTPKRVLIRAIGPSLASFGVSDRLANPRVTVAPLGSTAVLASNDDWAGKAELKAAFASVGAFELPEASLDSALIASLSPGGYTVVVTGNGDSVGNVLVELYDLDP